ncbi:hypothetical protein K491DRAFT_699440 [Lophiostoma macrostomum CBS 122681]|uniref:Uncharacterized protein n=1 Tax=Lophiostoma macrostomum CBS 122681 TaxID=1314788 RepID=A0A6A6SIM0_9PLEO|nr:hypothetical protein K491DRAFT_699440 [Lophiostoma macrostomum CBS 122681]
MGKHTTPADTWFLSCILKQVSVPEESQGERNLTCRSVEEVQTSDQLCRGLSPSLYTVTLRRLSIYRQRAPNSLSIFSSGPTSAMASITPGPGHAATGAGTGGIGGGGKRSGKPAGRSHYLEDDADLENLLIEIIKLLGTPVTIKNIQHVQYVAAAVHETITNTNLRATSQRHRSGHARGVDLVSSTLRLRRNGMTWNDYLQPQKGVDGIVNRAAVIRRLACMFAHHARNALQRSGGTACTRCSANNTLLVFGDCTRAFDNSGNGLFGGACAYTDGGRHCGLRVVAWLAHLERTSSRSKMMVRLWRLVVMRIRKQKSSLLGEKVGWIGRAWVLADLDYVVLSSGC